MSLAEVGPGGPVNRRDKLYVFEDAVQSSPHTLTKNLASESFHLPVFDPTPHAMCVTEARDDVRMHVCVCGD
jgi:hypothetical protein